MISKTDITKIIQSEVNEEVIGIIKMPRRLVYKITLKSGKLIRFDSRCIGAEEVRLQRIAYNNGVRVPEVLSYDQNMKISEWIDGVDMHFVRANPEVHKELGKLIGKLNITQDDENAGKYLAYGDITNKNFVWTKDEKLYIIDFDGMLSVDYGETVRCTIDGVGRRLHRGRWGWFLEGYTQYHPDLDIDEFIKRAAERKRNFHERKCEGKKAKKKKRG